MGAGASKDGEEMEVDDRYVTQSQSGSASGPTSPRPRSERKSAGQVRKASRMSMSRSAEGQEEVVIAVTRTGFSIPEVTIMEGQSVMFVWQEEERMDVVQVIHDGEKLRPVIGGFSGSYSDSNGQYEQQFNLEGEYKFALSGIRCTPLLVTVRRRVDLVAEVTDTGFQPDIMYIDQGHSIKWHWKQCNSPHSVQEVKYEINRACFKKDPDNAGNIKTVSGSYRHQFPRPGLYFFMTEGTELGRRHFCAVQVRETQREYKVDILDRSYQPMILLIEEGDRVWWNWDKQKCKKHHSIYQIEAPALNQGDDDPYVPVKDGFRWTTPSKQGLMSYEFFKPGVYYYSDQNFQEAAEYIGTIIVKPKQKELFVELTENGFNPDLAYAQTGDRIWWTWDGPACLKSRTPQLFALMETEVCLNPMSRKSSAKEGEEVYQYLDDESLALVTKVGLATTHFSTIGVYHYRVAESPDSLNTCSVIVNPGPKNHTIHLTDNGFEPKVITVRPNDRVWWVWQSGKKQHNILQVSHQGVPIENGFCSGSPRDAPSAFMHQFMTPGVFYFMSHSLPKLFGAIVVSTQPQVHEVNVGVEIKPDPVAIKLNDIVCWIFRSLRQFTVSRVDSVDQVVGNEIENPTVPPRRCMSKAITRPGVQHFYSKSFSKGKREKENFIDDVKISSVVCDERYDNAVVRVDKNGFHPAVYYIQKSQSVMWVWKGGEDEAHNIIHVKSPDSDEPLNVIHGSRSFNSGKPVPNNSFLYTFDEDGSYTVASQGAPGFFCTIVVLDVGMRVKDPFLDSSVTGGTVDPGTKVFLSCDTPGSKIFYTTDGSPPELHQESVKLYKPENGITLRRGGLAFVRAMATKEGRLNSHIYTSNRFWVMGDGDDDRRSVASDPSAREVKQPRKTNAKTWDWWGCIPSLKACFTNPGTLEVFWDPPEPGHRALIKGYQLFLNGVSYCDMFPPTNNSLCVSGMAGGRMYDIVVEVYSKKPDCQPQKSNKLKMKCPLITSDGGPVISLERNDKSDTLAIVWMSIDSPQNPISGYLVFLNDQQCGKRLVPDPESNRCKVVIGSCELEKPYKVYVVAIPADTEHVLMSNVLEVILPLDSSEIRLPPRESRSDEEELYLEYLEVNEGSGYLSAMDTEPRVYLAKRDHSFITESIKSEHWNTTLPAVPLSPVLAPREKTPLLPKDSRPPPVIYDASMGDEQRQRGPSEPEVDEGRYRDQSVMTDDNEKSTQTSSTAQKQRFKPQLDHDFIPPSLQQKGVSPGGRRRPAPESETETETESETETDSEMETADEYGQSQSMVVMDAQKPQAPNLAVRKEKKTPRTPKSGREFETPRQRGVSIIRDGREYVEVEDDGTTSTDREVLAPHPQAARSFDKPRKRRKNMAIIEVQDAVELDAKKNEESMEEERQVAVPAVAKESMRQIDEGQFITSDGDGILPAPSIMVESHGKSAVRVVWDLPRQPDPEYRLLLYVVNVVGTRFTGDINSDISFECNLVEKGKQVRGVQHCWNIQDKNKCTVMGLVPGLTYRLYVITNYTLVHGQQPCEIQTTSSVIYYTTVGPPRPPKLRVMSVDMHQALLEWEPPRLHEDLQLKGYQIYVDNKPLGGIRSKETRQMMINNLVPGKTLSVYVVAVTKQANQESDPSRVIHITCPRQPPGITVAQQPAYKQGCVLISWDRPKGHNFATNEEDISLYGEKSTGTFEDDLTDEVRLNTYDKIRQHYGFGENKSEQAVEIDPEGYIEGHGYHEKKFKESKGGFKGNKGKTYNGETKEIDSKGIDGYYEQKFGESKDGFKGTKDRRRGSKDDFKGAKNKKGEIKYGSKRTKSKSGESKAGLKGTKGKSVERKDGFKGRKGKNRESNGDFKRTKDNDESVGDDSSDTEGHGNLENKNENSKHGFKGTKGKDQSRKSREIDSKGNEGHDNYEIIRQQCGLGENQTEEAIEIDSKGYIQGHGYHEKKARESKDGFKGTKHKGGKSENSVKGAKGKKGENEDDFKRTKGSDSSDESTESDSSDTEGHSYFESKDRKGKHSAKGTKNKDQNGKSREIVSKDIEGHDYYDKNGESKDGFKGTKHMSEEDKDGGKGAKGKKEENKDDFKRTKGSDYSTESTESDSSDTEEHGYFENKNGKGKHAFKGTKGKDEKGKCRDIDSNGIERHQDRLRQQYDLGENKTEDAIEIDSKGYIQGHGYHEGKMGESKSDFKGTKSKGYNDKTKGIDTQNIEGHGYQEKKVVESKDGFKGTKGKGYSGESIEIESGDIEGHGYHKKKVGDSKDDFKDTKGKRGERKNGFKRSKGKDFNSESIENDSQSKIVDSHDKSEVKDYKVKRKKARKILNGNYFKGSSSESSSDSSYKTSESSEDSDIDHGEHSKGSSRKHIITVEKDSDEESDDLRQTISENEGSYDDRYKSVENNVCDSATNTTKNLREIEEFRDSNLEDIRNILKCLKDVDSSRKQKKSSSVGPADTTTNLKDRRGWNFKGSYKDSAGRHFQISKENETKQGDGESNQKIQTRRDTRGFPKQFEKKPSDKYFLKRLVETDSYDSEEDSIEVFKSGDNTSGSFKNYMYSKGNKGFRRDQSARNSRRRKSKVNGNKQINDYTVSSKVDCGQGNVKTISRKSFRGRKGKSFRAHTFKDPRGNQNIAANNVGKFGQQHLQKFRGINVKEFSGKTPDARETNKDGSRDKTVKEKPNESIYVDGKWYGEVKSNKLGNRHGYQYVLNDLNPEQSYDINVKAIAGYKTVDPEAQHLFCLSDGPMSNTLPVMAPAAPKSPKLRLEGLHPEGIDVTWLAPQQHGEAAISGYQMLKNGRLYGSIIPPEVNSLRIRDVSLGEKITLQLIALTEHPVGKIDRRTELLEKDSGIDGSGPGEKDTDVFIGEKYAGCRPGAKLVVHYTGLVCPPSQVWCERVTGHSALIVWNRDDEPKAHFIRPESYQVTWWPGDHPEDDIQSDSTSEDHLLITNLRPAKTYTVVVEARKMEKYKDIDEEGESVGHETVSAFILTAKSDNLIVKTARPPDAPSNLGVLATTCSAIKLAWDPPREHGVDVIGIRLDAVSLNTGDPHHVSLDVIPDATTATLEALREKTDYMIRVTAITDEYFDRLPDRHRLKKARTIPKDTILPADDSQWLPNCSILTKTSGTEPPAALKVAKASTTSLKLVWTPPIVYGSNKLQSVIVRWADVKYNKRKDDDDFVVASHVNLLPTEDTLVIEDLMPGNQYKIIVEAVVSVKTSLEKDNSASGVEKYRRTAHIMSRPLYARTRAPTEPPVLLITGYTQTTAQLYWEKPLLMSVVGKDAEGNPKYLRRYLEGYKLEINGKTYCHLGPASQSCQLTKCKPGKLYHVTLVALTCTEQGKKERKRKYKGAYKNTNPQDLDYGLLLEDEDNLDASPSEPLEITLPKNQDGYVASLDSFFTHNEDRDNKTFGDVKVQWTLQGPENTLIKQFNIIWYSHDDRVVQTKYVSPDFNKCSIPVTRLKSIYDVVVEPVYFTETLPQQPQNIQIMIPGPPDPPEIFLKSSSPEEFVIEWGEPRLFGGVRVRGYQVYMNDKKAGNELSSTHRKAVVPCRPNRFYKVNLVALSSNPEYHDSGKSNTLSINTSLTSPREGEALDELTFVDDHEVPLKVTKVTETSIHLDWANFLEVDGVGCYKIQWSSVAQPAEREVRLSNKDSNCVINKCLPGTTHFVRLVALDEEGQIKDRSKQLTVQTSAPPDGPTLSLRACNFRYIAVQWDKPNTYGDALITGYKVYVNGIVEAILNADQLSYTFTHGKWCQEYSFQVQALTSFEKMNSKPSEPLVVEWPGAKPPTISRLPTHTSSNLRVGWDDPYLTEGVKLKHFRVCCIEEDTEKMVSSIGPVHPDTREAEFKQIKKGSYNVYVEVHLYGTSEVVCSDPIKLQPAPAPDAPRIAATVVGFDERRMIEKITCDLVNKRDRLIRQVGHKLKQIGALTHPLRAEKDRDVIEGAHTLTRVEELLEDCFSALENYTGQLMAHVSWQCEQSNPDIQVSGYKVLIDGKQYGNAMHEGVKTVRIKLGTEQQVFRLSMVSLTDKPNAASEESNIIDLLSETFRCFSFYCYHSIHTKGTYWPDHGCCKYQDSIAYERQLAKKLANQGLLKKHVPPPSCSLLDIFDGEYKPLLQSHNRQYPTVILFWTPWCLPSQKIMTYFTRFARETTKEYNFVAVACGMTSTSAADRKGLIHLITANSWREDGTITHYTSQCASSIYEATNHIWKNTTGGIKRDPDIETESNVDLTDLLGIAGVPTFLFIHQEGYIAWHGRYSAYDYGSFAAFMRHTFSEVVAVPCPVFKCDSCKNDTSIDDETVETILQFTNNQSPFKNTSIRPSVIRPPSPKPDDDIDKLFVKRKQSPKRKQKNKLTVNQRPYSAHTTTYAYLLKSPYMERLTPSPKTHKILMRPASSRNVQVAYETL